MTRYIEDNYPPVQSAGLNTAKAVDFSAAPSVALPAATTINGSTVTSLGSITSVSATAFTVASTGSNYGLQIDESTASAITGLKIKAAASGNGVALSALGGTNEKLKLDGKGNAGVDINTASSTAGVVTLGNSTAMAGAFSNGPLWGNAHVLPSSGNTTLTAAMSGSMMLFDAAGSNITYTLPVPVVGMRFEFMSTATADATHTHKIITDAGTTFLAGAVTASVDNTASKSFVGNGTTHVAVAMSGASTNATGGILGTWLRFTAVTTTLWVVSGLTLAGGTVTTPFATS